MIQCHQMKSRLKRTHAFDVLFTLFLFVTRVGWNHCEGIKMTYCRSIRLVKQLYAIFPLSWWGLRNRVISGISSVSSENFVVIMIITIIITIIIIIVITIVMIPIYIPDIKIY